MPDQTPTKTTDDNSQKTKKEAQKELIEELKAQWKLLWSERYDDRVRAEGVSVNDYAILDIEKGTIIHATKGLQDPKPQTNPRKTPNQQPRTICSTEC